MKSLPVVLAFLTLGSAAQAQNSVCALEEEARSLKVRSVFDPMPPTGFAPLRVDAENKTDGFMQWDLASISRTQRFQKDSEHRGRMVLLTPPQSMQSGVFMAPMTVDYDSTGALSFVNQHEFSLGVDSTGHSSRSFPEYHARTKSFPAIAISKSLASANLTRLEEEVESLLAKSKSSSRVGDAVFGSTFDPADLAEDWRGLSGFDGMMITWQEWQRLKPGQRQAVQQWVRLYGFLDVYAEAGSSVSGLGLPDGLEDGTRRHSFGSVERLAWDGRTLDAKAAVERLWGRAARRADLVSGHAVAGGGEAASGWGLHNLLGRRSFSSWQVVVFLVVFGILVGPVNLFLLAPPGRRHRLFVTTPLLSGGMSLVMLVVVVVQDGVGGTGVRMVLVDIEPAETAAYVTQEQVCRTGVLLGGEFEIAHPVLIEPLALADSPWVKLKNKPGFQAPRLYLEGGRHGGTYFQSRVEQAHALRAVVPGRARLEMKTGLAPGAAPEVVSSLGFSIENLFYVDEAGAVWKAEHALDSGRSVKLSASQVQELKRRVSEQADLAVGQVRKRLDDLLLSAPPRNTFVATAPRAPGFTLDTLPSIDWKEDRVLLFGSLARP
ncbi:MAG: hypothetical protein CJBNEKGG_01981 [Prosthecobacter sp.]|nr:hypothetical protein [Prosthecobacter sp.]